MSLLRLSFHATLYSQAHLERRKEAFFKWKYATDRRVIEKDGCSPIKALGRERALLIDHKDDKKLADCRMMNTIGCRSEELFLLLDGWLRTRVLMSLEMYMIAHLPEVYDTYVSDTPPEFKWILSDIISLTKELVYGDMYSIDPNKVFTAVTRVSTLVTTALRPPICLNITVPSEAYSMNDQDMSRLKKYFEEKSIEMTIPLL